MVNYVYFGFLFCLISLIAASSIFTKENLNGSQLFFFLYAMGQIILEVALLIFCASLIRKYAGKVCFYLFIGLTFLGLIFHILDFLMDRILDLSVWEAVNVFVLQESFSNFLYLLDASGIPGWAWAVIFSAFIAIPFIGILLYQLADKIAQKKPLSFRHALFMQAFLCVPCALFFWDFSASKVIHPDAYTAFIKSLPWKYTFLHPKSVMITLPESMPLPQPENEVALAIESNTTRLNQRPNIYLFVIESLRNDSITESIAPHINAFKHDYSHFDMAISNGNGSHLSWFSIFHSQFPFYWSQMQKNWGMGSPALNLLKKWGYEIRLYTSAQLSYYGMEDLLFGTDQHLITESQTFHHIPPIQPADTDAQTIAKLQKDMAENPRLQQGQVFIIFWDCTHFDYNWPKNWTPKFTPYAHEMAYFKAFQSEKTIGKIKNRYHNAVNYMDSLFGQFFDSLPNKEESIVVVMGDHGEEFFEHGHLFHNSHLTNEQTHIPLFFKMGKSTLQPKPIVSQMDIFPTIIDYLSGQTPHFLKGNSLLQEKYWPFAITARFNGGQTPYEFFIHNGKEKMIAQFLNRTNIFESKELQILSLCTAQDKTIPECKNCLHEWVDKEFGAAFPRLFPLSQE